MRKLIAGLLILLVNSGCPDQYGNNPYLSGLPDTYVGLMSNGWDLFQSSDFTNAIANFQAAADRDAKKPEPYLGLGWGYARDNNLELAEANFTKALAFADLDEALKNILISEAFAGLAVVASANQNYSGSVSFVDSVLNRDPNFVFRYDSGLTDVALRHQALSSNFYLGNIGEVYATLSENNTFETVSTLTAVVNDTISEVSIEILNGAIGEHLGIIQISGGLVFVNSIVINNMVDNYSINSVDFGANTFRFTGNPLYSSGDEIEVSYTYAPDYGMFLDEILSILSAMGS